MEFGADAAIDHVCLISTVIYPHVVIVLEELDLSAQHALGNRLVPRIHRIVMSLDRLVREAHSEQVHLRAESDKLDDQITLCLVLEVCDLFGVVIASYITKILEMSITDFTKV